MAQQQKCEVEYYGKCGGKLRQREVVYHYRPRPKYLKGGSDEIAFVTLCDGHVKEIKSNNEDKLPELYGWDFADALDGLTYKLKYTGLPPTVFCVHCTFPMQLTRSETGACTEMCIVDETVDQLQCLCNEPIECVCASYNNNALHWGLLTYVNGFDYKVYGCRACDLGRPSWRDLRSEYADGLNDIDALLGMAKANPELILQKNANGKTPLDLIPEMIESIEETLTGYFLKSAENGWGQSNKAGLEKIKKGLIEVLDVYAN